MARSSVLSASHALRPAKLSDRVSPRVRLLFVGINPGIRSAETGHHFAGYSNRFWRILFELGRSLNELGTMTMSGCRSGDSGSRILFRVPRRASTPIEPNE